MLTRWSEIAPLFDEASALPLEQRAAFLDRACAGDPKLRDALDALLDADAADDHFMDSPLAGGTLVGSLVDEGEAPLTGGQAVGVWRVLREIGRGGMGAVYLAERAQGGFDQRAALKLIKRGMDTDAVVRRFERERAVLASLQHPHVARLLDGGTTDDGRPFFAMEHIEGLPLDAYCNRHRLGVEARLRLFLDVCEAVAYAHRNLVVHRDLKPANVLVTDDGEVKLLDFGIARLLAGDADDNLTHTGARVLTPAYAAPEQLRGLRPTTATDVYALGVVLYELLAGERPVAVKGKAASEIERAVLEGEPARPSTAVERATGDVAAQRGSTVERLRRRLRGDLDTICLKALRKEPERRYASAEGLAADVQRVLDDRPISARPDTLGYRARMFVRRNALGVGLAALAGLAVLGGLVGTTWQARVAAEQRDERAAEADRANATLTFVLGVLEDADPSATEGAPITAQRIVAAGRARLAELEGQPRTHAQMAAALGELSYSLGLYPVSDSLWRVSLRQRQVVLGPDHPEVAESFSGLALVLQDEAPDSAIAVLRRALSINKTAFGPGDARTLDTHRALAWMHYVDGRDGEALAMYRALLRRMGAPEWDRRPEKAEALSGMGSVLTALDQNDEAAEVLRDALQIQQVTLGERDPETLYTRIGLASVLRNTGDLDAARDLYAETLGHARQVLGPEHDQVAGILLAMGMIERERGAPEAAVPYHREALAVYRRSLGPEHLYTAIPLANWGRALVDAGRPREAERLLRQALTIYLREEGPVYPRTVKTNVWLGLSLVAQGRMGDAEPILTDAYTLVRDDSLSRDVAAEARDALDAIRRARDRAVPGDT